MVGEMARHACATLEDDLVAIACQQRHAIGDQGESFLLQGNLFGNADGQ
jgi:hypothetical protein